MTKRKPTTFPLTPVVKLSDPPESPDLLAAAIIKVSEGFAALQKSGLNRAAIVVLVKDDTGIPKNTINKILNSLADLKRAYVG